MLLIGGVMSAVTVVPVAGQVIDFDIWVMLVATLMLLPVLLGVVKLTRGLAALYFALYLGYVGMQAYGVNRILAMV